MYFKMQYKPNKKQIKNRENQEMQKNRKFWECAVIINNVRIQVKEASLEGDKNHNSDF